MCGVLTLIWISNQIPSNRMCSAPPLLLKHLRILCGGPTLVWTSDQMTQIEMCGFPPPPNYHTSYHFGCQSSSPCISECGTPSWACYLKILSIYQTEDVYKKIDQKISIFGLMASNFVRSIFFCVEPQIFLKILLNFVHFSPNVRIWSLIIPITQSNRGSNMALLLVSREPQNLKYCGR